MQKIKLQNTKANPQGMQKMRLDPVNAVELDHSKVRRERQLQARHGTLSVALGGTGSTILVELLHRTGSRFFSTGLDGWSLVIAAGTIIVLLLKKPILNLWWDGDDEIYEREVKRLQE